MDKQYNKLTLKQKLFCDYYLEGLGNATEAIIKAGYNVNKKNGSPDRILAKSIASENLTKPYILNYIKQKLEKLGFSKENIMKQHLFLINQFADLSVKVRAIDMYYKKTGAYTATKLEHGANPKIEAVLDRLSNMLP